MRKIAAAFLMLMKVRIWLMPLSKHFAELDELDNLLNMDSPHISRPRQLSSSNVILSHATVMALVKIILMFAVAAEGCGAREPTSYVPDVVGPTGTSESVNMCVCNNMQLNRGYEFNFRGETARPQLRSATRRPDAPLLIRWMSIFLRCDNAKLREIWEHVV
ncbi:hypothetical protein ACMD2_22197, partial [Ananas comosus]